MFPLQYRTRVSLALTAALAILGFFATQDGSKVKTAADATGGASGTTYEPAHQITSGEYQSSVAGRYADPAAESEGNEVAIKEQSEPGFAGWVNGIYIYPDASNAPEAFVPDETAGAGPPSCPGQARIVSEDELRAAGYYIDTPPGLPPGAVEHEGIYGEACGSTITAVSRQFELQPYGALLGLVLRSGERSAAFPAVAERVHAMTINGQPAVAIEPLTDDGFGNSAIFILTDRGLLQVGGYDVRFSDLITVARSIN